MLPEAMPHLAILQVSDKIATRWLRNLPMLFKRWSSRTITSLSRKRTKPMIIPRSTKITSEPVIWVVAKKQRSLAQINWRITPVKRRVKETSQQQSSLNNPKHYHRLKTFKHHIKRKWLTRIIYRHSRPYNHKANVWEDTNSNCCCLVIRRRVVLLVLVVAYRSNLLINRKD